MSGVIWVQVLWICFSNRLECQTDAHQQQSGFLCHVVPRSLLHFCLCRGISVLDVERPHVSSAIPLFWPREFTLYSKYYKIRRMLRNLAVPFSKHRFMFDLYQVCLNCCTMYFDRPYCLCGKMWIKVKIACASVQWCERERFIFFLSFGSCTTRWLCFVWQDMRTVRSGR